MGDLTEAGGDMAAAYTRSDRLRRELERLENRLTNPGPEETRESLAALLAEDFREYGSSGRTYDSAAVVAALMKGGRSAVHFDDYRVRRLGRDVALATYVARTAAGARWVPPALRSSLWQRSAGTWRLVFHQGTRAEHVLPASG